MLDPRQIRAARAMAGLTQRELAKRAKISIVTLNTAEKGKTDPKGSTLKAIEDALEAAGIEIGQNGGVRPRR